MFKKKIAILVAAALMSLSASSAFAAFADLELIRVVYERTTGTAEYVTDLGNINSIIAGPTKTFAGTALTAGTAANLYVAYFAIDRATNNVWASGGATAPVMTGGVALNTVKNGTTAVYNYYNTLAVDANGVATGVISDLNSYKSKLSANQGRLATALNAASNIEGSLASLVGATSGSFTQNLYYWSNASVAGAGQMVAGLTIDTNANGSTTITTAPITATPIPAAFYLMGSGLMGLVGLRRRNKVA